MATTGTTESAPEPTKAPEPTQAPVQDVAPEVRPANPGLEQAARGATEFKEDAVTVTPVPTLQKEDTTTGGRYYQMIADRIERRDAGMRYDVGQCPNCGHIEELPPGGPPRTTYMACPVCGDTIRFTGVGVRDPNTEPLPSISDDELRSK